MLPWLLLAIGVTSLAFGALQWRDYKGRQGDFGDWIALDASPLNRKVWHANRMVQMVALFVGGVVCLAAFASLMLK